MKDENKSKQQLIDELQQLRKSINSGEILDSEKLLKESAEVANIGYAIWDDTHQKYTFVSDRYAQICGCSPEDYLENYGNFDKDMMLVHPDDHDRVLAFENDRNGKPRIKGNIEYRIIRKDGKIRHILEYFNSFYDESGKLKYSLITNQDITKHKQLENKLLTQSQILNNMREGANLIRVKDSKIMYTNPNFDSLFGYERGELLGKHISVVNASTEISPEETAQEIKTELKHNGEWHGEITNIKKDGTLFICSASVSTFNHPEFGDVLISVHTDITEHKKKEEQLQRSQKLEALGKLTGGIAHDFNNLLGVILGYSQLLQKKLVNAPDYLKYIEEIRNAGERGSNLTKKLLSITSKQATKAEKADIKSLLDNQRDMLQKTLTVRIRLFFELEEVWPVFIDTNQLEDAILNICINAMHAMEETPEAKLTIKLCNQTIDNKEGLALGIKADDYVQLSFTDTGSGMNDITKAQIFDPFFTTKGEDGTGLGLSQVFGFVQRSGGVVKVISKLNYGSQFILYFPRDINENVTNVDSIEKHELLHGNEVILIVDDEQALLELASEILEDNGYKTITAAGGKEALQILETEHVDLVLTDVLMPDMNGYQLAACVLEQYSKTKVQLISGYTDEANIGSINKKFHQNMIYKPYNYIDLLTSIRALLDI